MTQQTTRPNVMRFLARVALIDFAVCAVIWIICWLANWRTLYQFGGVLQLVGGLALAIGFVLDIALSYLSKVWIKNVFSHFIGSQQSAGETLLGMRNVDLSTRFQWLLLVVGGSLIGLGAIIQIIPK